MPPWAADGPPLHPRPAGRVRPLVARGSARIPGRGPTPAPPRPHPQPHLILTPSKGPSSQRHPTWERVSARAPGDLLRRGEPHPLLGLWPLAPGRIRSPAARRCWVRGGRGSKTAAACPPPTRANGCPGRPAQCWPTDTDHWGVSQGRPGTRGLSGAFRGARHSGPQSPDPRTTARTPKPRGDRKSKSLSLTQRLQVVGEGC